MIFNDYIPLALAQVAHGSSLVKRGASDELMAIMTQQSPLMMLMCMLGTPK